MGWNLSGAVAYDSSGRVVQEGQPQFAEGTDLPGLAPLANPTVTSYDAQDRVVRQVLPDGATILSSFGASDDRTRLVQKTVDPLGNIEVRETDGRGNITSVSRCDRSAAVLMSATYRYDGLSQIVAAVDGRGNAVQASYDVLGRRASLQSPDTGIQTFTYDEAGNLARKITSVLRAKGKAIEYQYDGLNRLAAVIYPESAAVGYTYGGPGEPHGGAGRLIQREDASGTVRWQYGLLGETTRITRSITRLTPLEAPVSATLDYVSDYLGRLQQITYPDGEVVRYDYDSGGQVRKVTGLHWGQTTEYVRDIGYDEFGQRTYIEYGNGVRTTYRYDPARRWLAGIASKTGYGRPLQAMCYRFDLVGNILGYSNAGASYASSQSYGYDALYQLIRAEGSSTSRPSGIDEWSSGYQQSFGYDQIGNMTSKSSSCSTNPARSVGDDLNYCLAYSYYPGKGHQAEIIGRMYYRYDANGNVIEEREGGHGTGLVLGGTVSRTGDLRITDTGFGLVPPGDSGGADGGGGGASSVYARHHVWDEENRLTRTVTGNLTVDYRYGADGQRAVKYSSRGESLYFDSMWQAQTDYPSLRQSKHVYVGSTRVATRLNIQGQLDTGYERVNTYYYHGDHLGSSQLVTDYQGDEYERVEYTPYGESWIEKGVDSRELLPYKFTGKELDSETGLYYYGARYMDPRTSRWMSADPAMGEYLPGAPISDEARRHNAALPGMGGVFNLVNLATYSYAGDSPVKYTDPDGKYLHVVVSKGTGRMTVSFTLPGVAQSQTTYQLRVITNVQSGTPDNGLSSDQSRTQRSQGGFTNPTQLENGTYGLDGTRAPSPDAGNLAPTYKYGEVALDIVATQYLPDVDNPDVKLADSGYEIHITPWDYTNGCVGIGYDQNDPASKAEAVQQMKKLVELYRETMGKGGDKNATIEFTN